MDIRNQSDVARHDLRGLLVEDHVLGNEARIGDDQDCRASAGSGEPEVSVAVGQNGPIRSDQLDPGAFQKETQGLIQDPAADFARGRNFR